MKKLSLVIIAVVIFTGTSFAQQTQGTSEKKKTEQKTMTNKHVKKDKKAYGAAPAGK
jgi:Ni/Co efflux regulator RcnB